MDTETHSELEPICEKIRGNFDAKDSAREKGLTRSRAVIRNSANAIRAIHRGEFDDALALMQDSDVLLREVDDVLLNYPDVYHAGFVHDAQKEHAEAHQTYALILSEPSPIPTTSA